MKTDDTKGDYISEAEEALQMLGKGYEDTEQHIQDVSDLRKYRIELPNLYDDADLDPYEFRLLAHYKRVGTCTESTRTTGTKCHMSPAQVSVKRKSIRDKGFIEMEEVPSQKTGEFFYSITVLDVWRENFEKYSERSRDKQKRSLSKQSVHVVKQRSNHIKKEPIKKEAATPKPPTPPEILIFREVTKLYPPKPNWDSVVSIISSVSARLGRPATADDLRPFFAEWTFRGFKPTNINWTSWAVTGVIPQQSFIKTVVTKAAAAYDESTEALRRYAEENGYVFNG